MNYEYLKKLLNSSNSTVWVNGKQIAMENGVAVWEYDFGGLNSSRVVIRGVESNKPKLQFSSSAYGVFVDGKKLEMEKSQYLELFGQAGYLFSVVQPMKLKQQTQNR